MRSTTFPPLYGITMNFLPFQVHLLHEQAMSVGFPSFFSALLRVSALSFDCSSIKEPRTVDPLSREVAPRLPCVTFK
jgi:hypothetical protein